EQARHVADLAIRVAQHLPGRLEAHLLDEAGVRHAHPLQPALERAGARPHRGGDPMDVERAAREQSADDLPHAPGEVARGGGTPSRIPTAHVGTPPGRRYPRTVMIVRLAGGAVLPSRAVPRGPGRAPAINGAQWQDGSLSGGYRCSGHDALPPDGETVTHLVDAQGGRER